MNILDKDDSRYQEESELINKSKMTIYEACEKAEKYDELKEENQVLKQALMAYRKALHIQFTKEEYIAVNKADDYLWSK